MPSINLDLDRVCLHAKGVQQEIKDLEAIMSHVYYGRGWPVPDEETIANVVMSFRLAQREWGTVYLVFDGEDTGFGSADSDLERLEDESIEDDTHALLAWWDNFGYGSGEEAEPLRRKIGELAQVDYRHLTEPQ